MNLLNVATQNVSIFQTNSIALLSLFLAFE